MGLAWQGGVYCHHIDIPGHYRWAASVLTPSQTQLDWKQGGHAFVDSPTEGVYCQRLSETENSTV